VKEIGTRAYLRVFVYSGDSSCSPQGYCHEAELEQVAESEVLEDWKLGGEPDDYPAERWAQRMRCKRCGVDMSAFKHHRQVFHHRIYAAGDWRGTPQPGDLFYASWYGCAERDSHCIHGWTNCDGRHLMAVLPTGREWDIDSRASNCTLKDENTHRCWVRHGDPETGVVHVDKQGHTCAAGAGSIAVPDWHGFLHNGQFVP
jgi:hypothetical protein